MAQVSDTAIAEAIENYLNLIEKVPFHAQLKLSRLHGLDVEYQNCVDQTQKYTQMLIDRGISEIKFKEIKSKLRHTLIAAQEIGDSKLALMQSLHDFLEAVNRSADSDRKTIELKASTSCKRSGQDTRVDNSKRSRRLQAKKCENAITPVLEDSTYPDVVQKIEYESELDTFDCLQIRQDPGTERLKRARRARHEVFVPSILGPSTLEATSFAESQFDKSISLNNSTQPSTSSADLSKANAEPVEIKIEAKTKPRATAGTSRRTNKAAQDKRSKKRKASKANQNNVKRSPIPIDPDEPTYCLCEQVSFGEMIGCDNDLCPIEWFHFSCVALHTKPKGKWFCPKCRGDRPNVMKPKGVFLKELEKYNRYKEKESLLKAQAQAAVDNAC